MGTTLKKLASNLKDLQMEKIDGAHVLFKGIQLLAEHVVSPWEKSMKEIFPPAPIVTELVKAMQLKSPDFDLDTWAALAIQQAYLQVFQANLDEGKGMLETRIDPDDVEINEQQRKKLATAVETLSECDIDASQIDFPNLHNEPFVKDYLEQVSTEWLRMRLFKQEHEACEAVNFARRISYQLYPQLLRIVAEQKELYAPLAEYLEKTDLRELQELPEIEKYKACLMALPSKTVFNETFALRDLYVELYATNITWSSRRTYRGAIDIEYDEQVSAERPSQLMWTVLKQLKDQKHVVLIQAEPGKGKSVFCQMLAARVAAEYSDWIPIFIRLGDDRFVIRGESIEESFKEYIRPYFTLTDDLLRNRRFLFILDGFDELQLSSDSGHLLESFFEQLSAFQKACTRENHWNHKIIVTGRPIRIHDIESELPSNFLLLKIENMETRQFKNWLSNWAVLFGEDTASEFKTLLERGQVFQQSEGEDNWDNIRRLAGEPLLLYLLGAMHRDGALTQDVFETSPRRFEIYDQVVSWTCGYTRKHPSVNRNNRLFEKSGIQPDELRQLLQETALCIWHGGRRFAPVTHITKRLKSFVPEQVEKLIDSGFSGVHNVVVSFYFQGHEDGRGDVEFSHPSFGEYLSAKRIVEFFRYIGECIPAQDPRQEEDLASKMKEAAHRFYSVFGAALLTDEIRDFVMDILSGDFTNEETRWITEQLYRLYIDYSDGRWMDEGITRTQWEELKQCEVGSSLLRFEAQAGINLFVLLCLLYQHTDSSFEICGREDDGTFNPNRFRQLLGFGEFVETFGLFRHIHHLLKKVRLQRAHLVCANLRRAILYAADLQKVVLRDANLLCANLQRADLQRADVRGANLQGANLRDAVLQDANLEDVNLLCANLRGANLQGASLLCADLRDADLQGANLQGAILYGADLRGVIFQDVDTADALISEQQLANYRNLFSDEQIAQLKVVED